MAHAFSEVEVLGIIDKGPQWVQLKVDGTPSGKLNVSRAQFDERGVQVGDTLSLLDNGEWELVPQT